MAKAERGCNRRLGCACIYRCINGNRFVGFFQNVLERGLCKVEAIGAVDERACTFEAIPPGVLRFPACNFFFSCEQVYKSIGGHFGGLGNFVEERFVHPLERCRNFKEMVVEPVGVYVICNVFVVIE